MDGHYDHLTFDSNAQTFITYGDILFSAIPGDPRKVADLMLAMFAQRCRVIASDVSGPTLSIA